MTHSESEIRTRATARFGVLRSLCYPDATPTRAWQSVDTFDQRTTTHAKTDGRRLTKLNTGFFQKADIETQFVTLLHEVTHANDGGGFGRGVSSHSPTFWEEFQRNFNRIADSTQNRAVVESLFNKGRDEFDWRRARYRAVQQVSQVDERSETRDERREKLADAINYDSYDDFENSDWGLMGLVFNPRLDSQTQALQANLFGPTKRFADDFSDDELLSFIDDHDGSVPMPLVVLDVEEWRADGPQIIRDDSKWRVCNTGSVESRKALAAQERLGQGYFGLSAELLLMTDPVEYVEEACPIDCDEIRPRSVDIQKRSEF